MLAIRGLVMVAVFAIMATAFVGFRYAGPGEDTYAIEYKVICDQCNVTFRNEKGQSEEVASVKQSWSYKFNGNAGQFVYVSATNDNGKPVRVEITKAGQELIDGSSDQKDQDARAGIILEPSRTR